jgi:hypothetical protein
LCQKLFSELFYPPSCRVYIRFLTENISDIS